MHLVLIGAIVALLIVFLCQAIFRSGYRKGFEEGCRASKNGGNEMP
ncbi:MAG: hypothetical protein J5861_03480 [Desulfovibrio sp.]|nr:hypothetical protein [Desulfovibrio sp.]